MLSLTMNLTKFFKFAILREQNFSKERNRENGMDRGKNGPETLALNPKVPCS